MLTIGNDDVLEASGKSGSLAVLLLLLLSC